MIRGSDRSRRGLGRLAWARVALFLAASAPLAGALLSSGCAHAPSPDPDSTVLWGYLRLVPKAGSHASGGGYGDRRVADVKRVDYSQLKFGVVFVPDARDDAPAPAELVLREGANGTAIEPRYASTSPAAGVRVTNATARAQIVSVPGAARLERLAAGAVAEIRDLPPGEMPIHLLGVPDRDASEPAQVWVSDGPSAEVDATGRYVLRGLAPGPHQVRAWHPRLPPSPPRAALLARGTVVRLDLEIGLDAQAPASGGPR